MRKKYLSVAELIPGKQICRWCREKLKEVFLQHQESDTSKEECLAPSSDNFVLENMPSTSTQAINTSISSLKAGLSPVKMHGLNKNSKQSYKKRKLSEIKKIYQKKLNHALQLTSSDEEDAPEDRIRQTIPEFKVFEGLYSKKTEATDESK